MPPVIKEYLTPYGESEAGIVSVVTPVEKPLKIVSLSLFDVTPYKSSSFTSKVQVSRLVI